MGCCYSKSETNPNADDGSGSCVPQSPSRPPPVNTSTNAQPSGSPSSSSDEAHEEEKLELEEPNPRNEVKQDSELQENSKPRKEVLHRRSHDETTNPEDSSVSDEKSTVDADAILIQFSQSNSAAAKTRSFDFDQNGDVAADEADDAEEEESACFVAQKLKPNEEVDNIAEAAAEKKMAAAKKNPVQRIFTEEDEILLLEEIIGMDADDTRRNQLKDEDLFYDSVKGRISFEATLNQLKNKINTMARKFENKSADPCAVRPQDHKFLDLANLIWGPEGIAFEYEVGVLKMSKKRMARLRGLV